MRNKLITTILVVGLTSTIQAQQFSGTAIDLDSGRIQVIQGQVTQGPTSSRDLARSERRERNNRINAELSASIASMRQEYEMRQQTHELREQTRLLRKIADE